MISAAALDRPLDTLDDPDGKAIDVSGDHRAPGAGHASLGGFVYWSADTLQYTGGQYYGSMYRPVDRGSKGGGNGIYDGAAGGGVIHVITGFTLYLDGVISVDGGPAGGAAGGGSGGSVLVEVWELEGHGTVRAVGGDSKHGGGAGSGGRIAAYMGTRNHFQGVFKATGGAGSSYLLSSGGPGSVYVQDTRNTRPYNQLMLDNSGWNWDQYYTLDEPGIVRYQFNEVHLLRGASLQMLADTTPRNLTILKLYGDRTGRVHLRANHAGFLEKAEASKTTTKSPANIWIDEGAKAFMATLVYILGNGKVAFKWNGEVIGVQHLRIVPGRVVEMGPFAQTSSIVNGQYLPGEPGRFNFSSFELGAGSSFTFPTPMGMHFTVGFLVSNRLIPCGFLRVVL